MRYDGNGWNVTDFAQPDAMPGTAMAEVHSDNMRVVLFFFQDSYGFLCYRMALAWVWSPAVRICQAAIATPIAATTWNNTSDVRLYFQDKKNQMREFSTTSRTSDLYYDRQWQLGGLKMSGFLTSSMAAISWAGPEIKLYIQANDNSVMELSCGADFTYKLSPFTLDKTPNMAGQNTAIAAFRGSRFGFCHLYWASSDKILRQRILDDTAWLPADALGDLSTCGPLGAALLGPFTLNQLVEQTKCLSGNITDIGAQNTSLAEFVQEISNSFTTGLRPLAETAIAGIQVLAHSVEELSKASGTAFDELVEKCVNQSNAVDKRFSDLYNKAHTSLANATNLATDITYQQSTIQLRMNRVKELLEISRVMREGEENVVAERQAEITTAQKHLDMLEKAKRDAQDKRDEAEKLRIVRDVFTLGLGEAGDWGSLNDAMNYADKLIGYANTEIATSRTAKEAAQAAVNALNAELTQYTQLKTNLEGFDPILQSQLSAMTALAARILELENKALDVGVVLSSLVGKASVLRTKHTAKELAASVLEIATQIGTDKKLTGVFVTNPDSLQSSLEAIANSSVEPSDFDDLI
ncbi:hypothetical protein B0H19DRAFT_314924 [Mycena capillaripes]|nr:hypothetical protein B0H19DRAFT_314924 [Mycena capillaripes]